VKATITDNFSSVDKKSRNNIFGFYLQNELNQ
jgi:hypothetical protein